MTLKIGAIVESAGLPWLYAVLSDEHNGTVQVRDIATKRVYFVPVSDLRSVPGLKERY